MLSLIIDVSTVTQSPSPEVIPQTQPTIPVEVDVMVLASSTELPATEISTDKQVSETTTSTTFDPEVPAPANSVQEAPPSNTDSYKQASKTISTTSDPGVPASAKLTRFLQSDATFDEVLKVADADIKDILVRRYVRILVFSTKYQLNPLQILDVLIEIHKFPATGSCG